MYNWKNVQYANSSGILSAMNEADKQAAAGRQQMVDALSGFGDDYSKIQTDKAVAALSAAGTPEEAQSLMQQFSQNNSGWIDQTSLGEQYRDQVNDLRSATEFDATMKYRNTQTALAERELALKEAQAARSEELWKSFDNDTSGDLTFKGGAFGNAQDNQMYKNKYTAKLREAATAVSPGMQGGYTPMRADDALVDFNKAVGTLVSRGANTEDAKAAVTQIYASRGVDTATFSDANKARVTQKAAEGTALDKVIAGINAMPTDTEVQRTHKNDAINALNSDGIASVWASTPTEVSKKLQNTQKTNELDNLLSKYENNSYSDIKAAYKLANPEADDATVAKYMSTQQPLTRKDGDTYRLTEFGAERLAEDQQSLLGKYPNWAKATREEVGTTLESALNVETSKTEIANAKKNKATEVKETAVITNNNKKTLKDNRIKYSVNSLVNKTGVAKAKFTEVLDIVKNNAGFYKDPQNTWILIQAMDNVAIVDEDTLTDDINSNRQTGTITDFFMDTDPEVFAVDVLQEANRLRKVYADGGHTLSTGTFVNEPLIVMTPDQMTAMDKSFNKFKAKAEANAAKKKKLAADAAKPQVVVPAQQNEGILEQFFNSDLTGNPM